MGPFVHAVTTATEIGLGEYWSVDYYKGQKNDWAHERGRVTIDYQRAIRPGSHDEIAADLARARYGSHRAAVRATTAA